MLSVVFDASFLNTSTLPRLNKGACFGITLQDPTRVPMKSAANVTCSNVWLPPGSPLVTVRLSHVRLPAIVAFVLTVHSDVVVTFDVTVPAQEIFPLAWRRLLAVKVPATVSAPPVTVPFGIPVVPAVSVSCVPDMLYVKLESYATVCTWIGLKDCEPT